MYHLTWREVDEQAQRIAERWHGKIHTIYGVPQGGAPLAVMVSKYLDVEVIENPTLGRNCLVVDDLVDSGRTLAAYAKDFRTDAAFIKSHSPRHLAPHARLIDDWLVFPWEKNDGAPTDGIVRLIEFIGEDPSREGLIETPERVLRAWREMTEGYRADIAEILSKSFDVGSVDEMVILRDIPFVSICEHHLLPFTGKASLAYVPKDRVVGLSKMARLVDAYAKRLQVQERLTNQIRDALDHHLSPLGAGVIVEASHTCMCYRGVKKTGSMITSSLSGIFRNDQAARAELMNLLRN